MEGVRNFTIRLRMIFRKLTEHFDTTTCHHSMGELRLAPADVHRCGDVEEEIRCNATGIIPVFTETEEAIGAVVFCPITLGGVTQPHLPVDKVFALAIRTRAGIDIPVPLTLNR